MSDTQYSPVPATEEKALLEEQLSVKFELEKFGSKPPSAVAPCEKSSLCQSLRFGVQPSVYGRFNSSVLPAMLLLVIVMGGFLISAFMLSEPIYEIVENREKLSSATGIDLVGPLMGCHRHKDKHDGNHHHEHEHFREHGHKHHSDKHHHHHHHKDDELEVTTVPVQEAQNKIVSRRSHHEKHHDHHRRHWHSLKESLMSMDIVQRAKQLGQKVYGETKSLGDQALETGKEWKDQVAAAADDLKKKVVDGASDIVAKGKELKDKVADAIDSEIHPKPADPPAVAPEATEPIVPLIHGVPASNWVGSFPYPDAADDLKVVDDGEPVNVKVIERPKLPLFEPRIHGAPASNYHPPVPRVHGVPATNYNGTSPYPPEAFREVRGSSCHGIQLTEAEVNYLTSWYKEHTLLVFVAIQFLFLCYLLFPLHIGTQMLAVALSRQSMFGYENRGVSLWTIPFRYLYYAFVPLVCSCALLMLGNFFISAGVHGLAYLVHHVVHHHHHLIHHVFMGIDLTLRLLLTIPTRCVLLSVADSVSHKVFPAEQFERKGVVDSMLEGLSIFYSKPIQFVSFTLFSGALLFAGPVLLAKAPVCDELFLVLSSLYLYSVVCFEYLVLGHLFATTKASLKA